MADLEDHEPPDPRIGNVLQGRYKILSRISSGAMGVVYRGERLQLGRAVAIKFLHPWIAAQKAFLSRFENEAKAMSRLSHPHCVSVIDFGVEGAPYLVMDFITGRTLRELMHTGALEPSRALRLTEQLLAGLAHAHANGIVHRDLKPENLILSTEEGLDDHLRILDFGLAKLRGGPAMTTGLAVGTPSYMSPEQSGTDAPIDARTDLYTVGVVLFELLVGRKPFQSESVGELILMHRETAPPLLRDAAPEARFSAALEAVVSKAMSKMPSDRYQSAAEMVAALLATPEARRAAPPAGGAVGDGGDRDHPREKSARGTSAPPRAGRAEQRKPPAPADATTIDTLSAVRRRVGTPAGISPKEWRLAWLGATFVIVSLLAMLGLVIGRSIRRNRGTSEAAPATATAPLPAPSPPAAPSPATPKAGDTPATTAGNTAPTAGNAPAAPPAKTPASTRDAANARLDEARRLIAENKRDEATALLKQLRAQLPDNADVPYLLAIVAFDQHRWSDAVSAAQLAVRKNQALRADPDLVKGAIRSLASDRVYTRSQAFLRSLGSPAISFIKEAARHDPDPRVRARAAEILGSPAGDRDRDRGARGWTIHPSPSSGPNSSLFRR